MLTKGYIASHADLVRYAGGGQMKVNRHDGSLVRPDVLTERTAARFLIRPAFAAPIQFYAVTHFGDWYLIALSDGHVTRYYRIENGQRKSVVVNEASNSFESAWENLFKGLLVDDRQASMTFYNQVYGIPLAHFINENVYREFAIEGHWQDEEFIASIDWDPVEPHRVEISSTLDGKDSRNVILAFHPIEAVHRVAMK